jgi:hypothetical protein
MNSSINRAHRTGLAMSITCLLVMSAAAESNWSILSQHRRVWSTVNVEVPGDSDTDTQEMLAGDDFGLFDHRLELDERVQSLDGETFADAQASADLDVLIAFDSLNISSGLGATSETTGSNSLAEADALTSTSVTFAVTTSTRLGLAGYVEVYGFGQAQVELIDESDQTRLVSIFLQESGAFQQLDELIDVEPGTYRLSGFAFGDAESRNFAGLDGQSAGYAMTLNLQECYTEESLYAVAADSPQLWVNQNPLGDGDWNALGELPAGATGATDIAINPDDGKVTTVAMIGGNQRMLTFDIPTRTVDYNSPITITDPLSTTGIFGLDFTANGSMKACYRILFGGAIGEAILSSGFVLPYDTYAFFDLNSVTASFAVSNDTEGIVYVTGGDDLLVSDWTTQTSISTTPLSGGAELTALEISPTDNIMVGCRTTQELVRIDPVTGAVFLLGSTPIRFDGFAFSWPDIQFCAPITDPRCDLNGDGLLNGADLDELESCAQGPAGGIASGACVGSDVNRDGAVDVLDYAELSRCMGQPYQQ